MTTHPCLSCGACCAFFRVSFHWTEVTADSYHVPEEKTVKASQYMNSMRGTEIASPYCASLEGKVGESVSCAIYENRPSPCRKFAASYENGLENLDCNRARAGKGLAALTLAQWQV